MRNDKEGKLNTIDHTVFNKFTMFIPQFYIKSNDVDDVDGTDNKDVGEWLIVNEERKNWLMGKSWTPLVHTIVKLTEELIMVIWVDQKHPTVYKGLLI